MVLEDNISFARLFLDKGFVLGNLPCEFADSRLHLFDKGIVFLDDLYNFFFKVVPAAKILGLQPSDVESLLDLQVRVGSSNWIAQVLT